MKYFACIGSPIGRLRLASDGESLTGIWMEVPGRQAAAHLGRLADAWSEVDGTASSVDGAQGSVAGCVASLAEAARQLREYFEGSRREFDLPLSFRGTEFQERVWRSLMSIPYGETWSYRELAGRIGNPSASRAVGLANGRNPIPIVVPCHRVIGADGSLTGYGGGLQRKQWLLAHEARQRSLLVTPGHPHGSARLDPLR
ncbi:MAG TPA: methylated-DNA--[protein]-cysteine S-methyltransferase [Steroidobacteraceae bacterium]|nr:methylated-DNA--[protein]-cysteine S-methyltransferase [Steroidobacteraceae bacterium]